MTFRIEKLQASNMFSFALPTWTLPLTCVVVLAIRLTHNRFGYGITAIPGPVLAPYTDLWRLLLVRSRRPEVAHIRLHEKHGALVRLGPNVVSVSDPEAIKIIYGLASGFSKVSKSKPFHLFPRSTDTGE